MVSSDLAVPFYLSYAALWILVVLHSLILLGVVRILHQLQTGGVARSGGGLARGEPAPAFRARDLQGNLITSDGLLGRAAGLLFISPDCPACADTLERDLGYLQHKADGNLMVVCRGLEEACRRLAEKHDLQVPMILDETDEVSRLYRVSYVPVAVLLDAEGRVRSFGQPDGRGEEGSRPDEEATAVDDA